MPTGTATAVKCVLYASGGTQTEMDQQTVSIVVDVSNLTQEIIFDTLTNNGEDQGIYLKDGKVYVNMTYARSGTLALGGLNDTNGLLRVYDESNQEIGHWGSDGVVIEKGSFTTTTGSSTASIGGGRVHVSWMGTEVGGIGANRFESSDQQSGLVFDLESEGAFMAWSARNKSTDTSYSVKFMYAHKDFSGYSAGRLYLGAPLYTGGYDILLSTGGILKSWTETSGFKTDNFAIVPTANNTAYLRAKPTGVSFYVDLDMNGYGIYNHSDARLKDNIRDVSISALDAVKQIKVKSFDWLTDGRHVDAGIIAQQLQQIIPGLVREDEKGLLSINYVGLIPYLVKAIQELYTVVMPANLMSLEEDTGMYGYTVAEKRAAVELAKPPVLEDIEPEKIIIEENS